MRDPERLLNASDADPLERELLVSLRDERVPTDVRRAAWQGIAAGVAAAASASASTAAAASVSLAPAASSGIKAAGLLVTKWALVGALGAGAVGGAIWVAAHAPAPQQAARPVPAVSAPVAPRAPELPQPRAAEQAAPEPAAPEATAPSKRPRVNALLAESALLQTARAELRAGSLGAAERTLGQLQRRYPRGELNQERDVLRIELLRARGDFEAARRSAASFLRRYPQSPHASQLTQLMAAP